MEKLTGIFRGLANLDRLRIVYLLAMSDRPLCVCEIVDALDLPQYQVSKHLRTLARLDLISTRRDGRWSYCSLAETEGVRRLTAFLLQALPEGGMSEEIRRLHERLALRRGGRCTLEARKANRA